jgi:hypothetical protein
MTADPGLLEAAARRRAAMRDAPSAFVGVSTAIVVHLVVIAFALRAGAHEGNIARATDQARQQPPEEEIIEGALLRQGGGGEFDPRTIHRQPPIRSEVHAAAAGGLAKNQNPTPVDPNVRHDPNALITQRDILGHGNQDLAEQLQRLAQSETETTPGTQPGPGSPDGSVNGTETDPSRAGHGATAKIASFIERQVQILSQRTFVIAVTVSEDGTRIARASIRTGSGDDTVDSDLTVQLQRLVENQEPIPDLSDEEKAAIAGHSYRLPYHGH